MKKVFIDGGANTGMSIELFLKKYPDSKDYIIHSFECDPRFVNILENTYASSSVVIHKKALYDKDGIQKFFVSKERYGSSLNNTKNNVHVDTYVEVETIDISKFITDNFKPEDHIVLKLDIEGAEYEVLERLLQTNVIEYINAIYGEWHYTKLLNIAPQYHFSLINRLLDKGLEVKDWDAIKGTFKL